MMSSRQEIIPVVKVRMVVSRKADLACYGPDRKFLNWNRDYLPLRLLVAAGVIVLLPGPHFM